MARVSIIVPIYNVEKYVEKCLQSLLRQTFKDIEIWAISDGSPDNSIEIIKKYSKKDKRIKCVEKENGGYGSVLEYAIKKINTEYFLICDPDDWLADNAVEILYNSASSKDVDLVVGGKYLVYSDNNEKQVDDSKIVGINLDIKSNVVYRKNDGLEKALFLTPSPHSKLYRTKWAKKIKFPKKVSFTDFLLYVVYINRCNSFMYIEDTLSYYLVDRPGNTMTDVNPRIFDYHTEVFNSIIEQIENHNEIKYFYSRMLNQYRYILYQLNKLHDEKEKKKRIVQLHKLLEICQRHQKEINSESFIFDKKTAMFNKLLLNKFTSKYFFKRLIKSEKE